MTPQEYMDPERFPQTTQRGLTLRQQMTIDAVNYGDVIEAHELGTPIKAEHMATVTELDEKHAARDQVYDAAKAAVIL